MAVHTLKHSYVSLLVDMGFNAVEIADRLGHESIEITYRYAHLFPTKQVDMVERLNSLRVWYRIRFYKSKIMLLGTDKERTRNGQGTDMERTWNGHGTDKERTWNGHGTDMERTFMLIR